MSLRRGNKKVITGRWREETEWEGEYGVYGQVREGQESSLGGHEHE